MVAFAQRRIFVAFFIKIFASTNPITFWYSLIFRTKKGSSSSYLAAPKLYSSNDWNNVAQAHSPEVCVVHCL